MDCSSISDKRAASVLACSCRRASLSFNCRFRCSRRLSTSESEPSDRREAVEFVRMRIPPGRGRFVSK